MNLTQIILGCIDDIFLLWLKNISKIYLTNEPGTYDTRF